MQTKNGGKLVKESHVGTYRSLRADDYKLGSYGEDMSEPETVDTSAFGFL
jgi:hypothetical protein